MAVKNRDKDRFKQGRGSVCNFGKERRQKNLRKKEAEVRQLKKILDEEQRVNAKNRSRQYRMERDIGQLRRKVTRWENQEEEQMSRKRELTL